MLCHIQDSATAQMQVSSSMPARAPQDVEKQIVPAWPGFLSYIDTRPVPYRRLWLLCMEGGLCARSSMPLLPLEWQFMIMESGRGLWIMSSMIARWWNGSPVMRCYLTFHAISEQTSSHLHKNWFAHKRNTLISSVQVPIYIR